MIAMIPAELEALAEHKLGDMRSVVEPLLRPLAERMRPGEQLETLAIGWRGLLIGGGCLLAATDQRLLLLWSSSHCEELRYGDLISVTDDAPGGEICLVTPRVVHTFRIMPAARAAEIVKAAAERIGENRIHLPAGADQARWMTAKLAGAAVSACLMVGGFALGAVLPGVAERWHANHQAHEELSKGSCVDLRGLRVACRSGTAVFVVLGDRDMQRCPSSSAVVIDALAATKADTRKLSRWCIGPHVSAPAR
jgi:hypothetical protein